MLPVIGPGLLVWSYKEIQFVAVSAGPGCVWEGLRYTARLTFICSKLGSRSPKGPMHPEIHLHLLSPAGCLLGLVTGRASGGTRVVSGRFSVSHHVVESSVQKNDADSKSVPVLGLRLLSTSQGTPRPAATCEVPMDLCVVVGSQGDTG